MKSLNHHVITICGSSQQKEDWEFYQKKFTLEGNCVLVINIYLGLENSAYNSDTPIKRLLLELHKQKIRMADSICFILKPNKTLGNHTISELIYAHKLKKEVFFVESIMKV